MDAFTVTPLHAFQDNCIWTIQPPSSNQIWVVDPGDAAPVITALHQTNKTLSGILLTHHHADHSGGIAELLQIAKNIPVIASHQSKIRYVTQHVKQNDVIDCNGLSFTILEIPGHTLDHIAFYAPGMVFCGDTLFSAGCGKVFEGTYAQMYASLLKLKILPDATKIFCGHEYTFNNLRFAATVEPNNPFIQQKLLWAQTLSEKHQSTLPSLLMDEKNMNPFLRCHENIVQQAVEQYSGKARMDEIAVFQCLREWKNQF